MSVYLSKIGCKAETQRIWTTQIKATFEDRFPTPNWGCRFPDPCCLSTSTYVPFSVLVSGWYLHKHAGLLSGSTIKLRCNLCEWRISLGAGSLGSCELSGSWCSEAGNSGDVFWVYQLLNWNTEEIVMDIKNVSHLVQYFLFLTKLQPKYIFMLPSSQCIKNSFRDIKDIGFLQVKVLKAVDLLAADFSGILSLFSSIWCYNILWVP